MSEIPSEYALDLGAHCGPSLGMSFDPVDSGARRAKLSRGEEDGRVAMWRLIATLIVGLALVLVTIGVVFFVGMRTGSPFVRDVVRRFNRAFMNPHQMKTAGTPGAYASVIGHVGRTTSRPHETPVVAYPTRRWVRGRAAVRAGDGLAQERHREWVRHHRPRRDHVPSRSAGARSFSHGRAVHAGQGAAGATSVRHRPMPTGSARGPSWKHRGS